MTMVHRYKHGGGFLRGLSGSRISGFNLGMRLVLSLFSRKPRDPGVSLAGQGRLGGTG